MRNKISHGYFSVDLEVIWKTVERDIPELEQQVRQPRLGFKDSFFSKVAWK